MRLAPFLIMLMPLAAMAAAADPSTLVTLGTVKAYNRDSKSYDLIPVSSSLIVGDATEPGMTNFVYNGAHYRAKTSDLDHLAEVHNGPASVKKMLEHLSRLQPARPLQDPICDELSPRVRLAQSQEGCPLGKDGKLKGEWNDWSAGLMISKCSAPKLSIVAREFKGPNDASCRPPKGQDLSKSKTWQSCPTPPACSEDERKEKDRLALERMAQDKKLHCAKGGKDWKKIGDGPRCMIPFRMSPSRIVIHHSGVDAKIGPDKLESSKLGEGYTDLPYHFVLAPVTNAAGKVQWRIFEGRPLKYEGAHAGAGLNADSIGIAIAGDYDGAGPSPYKPAASASQPPPEAVRLLMSLVAGLKSQYPSLKTVEGHGEFKYQGSGCHTNCPSPECQRLIHRLRERYFDDTDPASVPPHLLTAEGAAK